MIAGGLAALALDVDVLVARRGDERRPIALRLPDELLDSDRSLALVFGLPRLDGDFEVGEEEV